MGVLALAAALAVAACGGGDGQALVDREAELAETQEELAQQEGQVNGLEAKVAMLTEQAGDLQRQIDDKASEIDDLQGARDLVEVLEQRVESLSQQLGNASGGGTDPDRIREVATTLEIDRLLLADMRKDSPEVRAEAQRFWVDVKALAVKSDPSLGPKADRVSAAIPVYFDWLERDFSSVQEANLTYLLTGASNYDSSINEFWGAFVLVLMDRIDVLVRLAD